MLKSRRARFASTGAATSIIGCVVAVIACTGDPALIGDGKNPPAPIPSGSCSTPHPGCACTNAGAQADCGQVIRRSGDYVTCSEGTTTCSGGVWGTCVGDSTYIKSTESTGLGGIHSQGLQNNPTPCTSDPCDPNCTDYTDDGTGLDAGVGLTPTDAGGITLSQVDGSSCANLQCQQVGCTGNATTSISGRIVAGTLPKYGNPDPIPDVLVYVPNSAVQPFAAGVQCDTTCSAEVTGSPIALTVTNYDGTFTLTNVPVGNNIPIVVQLGRWRRQVTFDVPTSCVDKPVGDIRLPRNHTEGDIPFTAVSTGDVDALECVLLKMGVDQAEFTDPGGGGRIEIYQGNGAVKGWTTPNEPTLVDSPSTLAEYDQLLFPCWGGEYTKSPTEQQNLVDYANEGGRVFTTHYSYTWLFEDAFSATANWDANAGAYGALDGEIDTSFAKGQTLAKWMNLLNALDISNVPPDLTISNPRWDVDSVISPSVRWIYNNSSNNHFPLHFTFDTPFNSLATCGRVVYSDFHVVNSATDGSTFPNECDNNAMGSQEKVLEFLLYDLASCGAAALPLIPPYPNPATFTRDYEGVCPAGKTVVWRFFDWETVTPSDSNIVFSAVTADTETDLDTATPSVALGTASGAPITTWTGTDVSAALAPNPSLDWLRVTVTLNPSSNHYDAPTLTAWRQQFDCIDAQ